MRAPRSVLMAILMLGVIAAPLAAEAQQAKRLYRIGVLTEAFAPNHPAVEGLRTGLRTLGLEEGRDVSLDVRFTGGSPEALPAVAAAMVNAGVDLIFTTSEPPTRAAMAATKAIPIVFTLVGDPVAEGIVRDLAHPRGNVTGVSGLSTELVPKRLEILKTIVPTLRRVWAIYPADNPTWAAAAKKAREAAPVLQLQLVDRPVRAPEEVTQALEALRPGDGLLPPITTVFDIPGQIWYRSGQVPAIFASAFWTRRGALVSYGSSYDAEGVQAARLVAKILGGAKPSDLPVEQTTKFELVINLKTAKALGLTIPQSLVLRADEIIQ
ncbi:MAG: ABC transporter substrate-binding protein [Candidatus Rokubacteria bacterium]|nr:ABC transporter substrate-binding protein [Candidatus Rokubacteria bacterium]